MAFWDRALQSFQWHGPDNRNSAMSKNIKTGTPRSNHGQQLFGAIDKILPNEVNVLSVKREIVPIIFVPGIMGSVLMGWDNASKRNDVLWDPAARAMMVGRYGAATVNAADKRAILVGSSPAPNIFGYAVEMQSTRHKGWEGVTKACYDVVLHYFDRQPWPSVLSKCFYVPIHAYGYNWTDTNRASAEGLRKYARQLVAHYQMKHGGKDRCSRIILMTHSMGGLCGPPCVLGQDI